MSRVLRVAESTAPRRTKAAAAAAEATAAVEAIAGEGFDVARFVENFDVIAEAAGGVGALRGLVVDLAVRGRLTNQVHADGLGQELRSHIRAERSNGALQGRLGPDSEATAEGPFELPSTWTWCTMAEIALKLGAGSTPLGGKTVYRSSGVKFLRSQNVYNDGLRLADVAHIARETHVKMSGTHVEGGDILLNITGASIGRVCVVPEDFDEGNVSQHVAIVRLVDKRIRRFVHLAMTGSYFQRQIMSVQVGVSREGLSMKKLQLLPIPLPPLAEQKRIVAKVDQLMALCDELEARQTKKRETSARLTKSALEALTTAEGPDEFDAAWKRVVENFDVLIDRAEKVGELRRAVVALALRGALVPRLRSDGSAQELLERLDTQRLASIDPIPCSHGLPPTWRTVPLGALLVDGPKNGFSPRGVDHVTAVKSLTLTATTSGTFDPQHFKYLDLDLPPDSELWLRPGDLLVQRSNTIQYVGTAAIYRGPERTFIYPDLMMRMRVSDEVSVEYVHMAINGRGARQYMMGRASGTSGSMPKINQATVLSVPIPLPPAGEQRRIVAKVAKLMTVCDQLQAGLRDAEILKNRLAEAVVEEFVA